MERQVNLSSRHWRRSLAEFTPFPNVGHMKRSRDMMDKSADFGSLEDLAELLEAIGLRLHAKNRIGGESGYVWHLAETIRGAGRLAARAKREPDVHLLFGDGNDAGSFPADKQQDRFLALLRDQLNARE